MTRAVIYARRSTEEHQAASLDVQITEATRFCESRGWSVVQTFQEEAVSRAEFKKRPALISMLAAATSKPRPFDRIVLRDETRLGGDMYRTGIVVQDLLDAGVRLFYYISNEEVSFDDPTSKLVMAVRAYASELERVKIASRTREHLQVKARQGYNVGGRVFGYDNVEVKDGDRRLRVEYRINPREAEVVQDIFRQHAEGEGVRAITKTLNAQGVPPPRAGVRGTGSWAPSCIWEILHRERYRGTLVWGRVGGEYRGGTRVTVERPEEQCTRVERPDLRIIDEDLWQKVRSRSDHVRVAQGYGKRAGRPKYLLTGLARCAQCGGPMHVINGKDGRSIIKVYACAWHRDRGDSVCTNTTRRPVDAVDESVTAWIRENILNEGVVAAVLAKVRQQVEDAALGTASDADTEGATLERELARLENEIARLTSALATTDGPSETLVRAVVEREGRARTLRERLAARTAPTPAYGVPPWSEIAEVVRHRLVELPELFARNVDSARQALGTLLSGPLQFASELRDGKPRYAISGEVATGFMFAGDPNGN